MPNKGQKHTGKSRERMRKPKSFTHRKNISLSKRGELNPKWKGGRRKHSEGYVQIWCPTHPCADGEGYVREHRLIMEKHLGRTLLLMEIVHHINDIKDDNRIENLMLFANMGEHISHHKKGKREV